MTHQVALASGPGQRQRRQLGRHAPMAQAVYLRDRHCLSGTPALSVLQSQYHVESLKDNLQYDEKMKTALIYSGAARSRGDTLSLSPQGLSASTGNGPVPSMRDSRRAGRQYQESPPHPPSLLAPSFLTRLPDAGFVFTFRCAPERPLQA